MANSNFAPVGRVPVSALGGTATLGGRPSPSQGASPTLEGLASRVWADPDPSLPDIEPQVDSARPRPSSPVGAAGRRRADRRLCGCHGRPTHVISQSLFRDALTRAQRRGARFDQTFGVLYVRVCDQSSATRKLVADAACTAAAEDALVGWALKDHEIGIILPQVAVREVGVNAAVAVEATERHIWQQLSREFGDLARTKVSIRADIHESSKRREIATLAPAPGMWSHRDRGFWCESSKRAMDIALSVLLLVGLSPVFLLLAILIKAKSPGPVLFKQVRLGRGAKPFTMLKFRTMQTDADPTLHRKYVESFINADLPADPGDARVFKMLNDPRITPIGRTLRRTSLDELPQFWNVLVGEMSLVGPRPPLQYELAQYRAWHWRRVLEAKPGVTGLWQVRGRSRTTFDEMVRLDLQYVRTRSLWLDFKILLATPRAVFSGSGAC